MSVRVRRADEGDFATLVRLIVALAEYEELTPPDEAARERFKRDGWPTDGSRPRFTAWLAETIDLDGNPKAVGYAITFETYSSFLARPTLYIEDLFVLTEARRAGVGQAVMDCLIAEARQQGCGRLEWVVLDWNTSAQQFYRKQGAWHLTDWQYYRLPLEPTLTGTQDAG